ncbi:MAG: sel1 repeat family protein [Clostridiales bacterium]|nr:sel1 repeat family protein [Clostridiales bacterium]
MKKDRLRDRVAAVAALILAASMMLASCSKEEETTKKKSKKSKDKETEDTIDDESDPIDDPTETSEEPTTTVAMAVTTTTASDTVDSDRSSMAGTYNGYAVQTKAEAYPEYGSLNNYPIIHEDTALVLYDDGTATLEYDGADDVDIEDWNISGEQLTIDLSGTSVSGTVKDGIVTLELGSTIMFFASDDADTSVIGAITPEEAYVVEGDDFYFGTGPSGFDLVSARTCYETAGKAGVGKGWYCLGRLYHEKSLEEGHFATAMSYYEKAVELGDPNGWVGEGFLYAEGSGVEKDIAKAYTLFQQAADAGCLMGYNGMALLLWEYDEIPGITSQDTLKALEYYDKASQSRDWYERVFALNGIGRVYRNGPSGIQQDYAEAMKWTLKAADEGYPSALNNVGTLYYYGQGVELDYKEAAEWFVKAADAGYGSSCATLAYMYEHGMGVTEDPAKAFEWSLRGAECGNVDCVFDAGYYLKNGIGTQEDYGKAMEYFLIAARENYARAYGHIGDMYSRGMGVNEDIATALEYWRKGCDLWDSSCAADLGWAYMYGKGVDVDYETALDYFALAIYCSSYDGYQTSADYAGERIDEMVDAGYVTEEQVKAALAKYGIS